MQHRTATLFGMSLLAALTTAAMAQPGGGGGGGRQGGPPDPQQFIDRLMENDANGDGKLAKDELPQQFAERLFDGNDANGDGFLDKTELQKIAENFGQRGPGGQRPGGVQPGQPGQPGLRPGGPEGRAPVDGAPAPAMDFESAMKMAGRSLRQLRRSAFDDASRATDLRAIQTIQSGLIAAKAGVGGVPMAPQAQEQYKGDEVKYQSDFRLALIQAIMESLALEAAVIEGDSEGAKESLAHLLEAQKAGHGSFQKPQEEEDADAAGDAIPEPARVRPGRGRPGGDA